VIFSNVFSANSCACTRRSNSAVISMVFSVSMFRSFSKWLLPEKPNHKGLGRDALFHARRYAPEMPS